MMALRRAFRAEDRITYQLWPSGNPPLIHYNDYLIDAPRVYQEELACMTTAAQPGVIYVTPDANPYAATTINFLGLTNQVAWPGWNVARWRFDGQTGKLLGEDHLTGLSFQFDALTVEPNGAVWWYGPFANIFYTGAVRVSRDTGALLDTTSPYPTASFNDSAGNPAIEALDLAINTNRNRLFARWSSNLVGQVSVYELSTRTYLGDIWTPNQSAGIVLTEDGFVYVVDDADWIVVYSDDLTYHGALRNPRRHDYVRSGTASGFALGWDPYYKRLLFCGAVANSVDGQSKMRIWGYYPVPDAAGVTPPLPRQVPRAGRRSYVFSHIYGEGGEPLGARTATATGSDVASGVSDAEGDIVLPITPSAAGSPSVSLVVNVDTTPADATETDAARVTGRTLLVTLEEPCTPGQLSTPSYAHGSSIPLQVTVGSGGVGPYSATFYWDTGAIGGSGSTTIAGAGPTLTGATTAITIANSYNIAVVVTDSAGNKGQESLANGILVT